MSYSRSNQKSFQHLVTNNQQINQNLNTSTGDKKLQSNLGEEGKDG